MKNIIQTVKSFNEKSIKLISSNKARKFIVGLFVIQAVVVALSVRVGYPPDELYHIRFIEYLANNGPSPFTGAQKNAFYLGDISRIPEYLYQYIMSFIYRDTPFSTYNTYMAFRFISVGLSAATLLMLARLGDRLKIPTSVTNFSLLILSNSAQFLFLSASINSDLLVWFLVASSLCVLVDFINNRSLKTLFFLAGIVTFGMVTKRTFMPIGFMIALAAAIKAFTLRETLFKQLKKPDVYLLLSIGFFVVGFGLFAERVGVNLIKYQQIKPTCMDLHTKDECIQNGVERRNFNIKQAGIEDTHSYNILEYGFGWSYLTVSKLVGTQGWTVGATPPAVLTLTVLLMSAIGLFGSFIEAKAKTKDKQKLIRLIMYFGSLAFIIYNFWFNYQVYQRSHLPGLALQGRYILPLATIFLLLSCYYIHKHVIKHSSVRRVSALLLLALVLYGSGLHLILTKGNYTDNVFRPKIIFDRDNLISEYEPSI